MFYLDSVAANEDFWRFRAIAGEGRFGAGAKCLLDDTIGGILDGGSSYEGGGL